MGSRASVAVALVAACAAPRGPVRLARPTPVAAAFVMERGDAREVAGAPDALVARVRTALARRNLVLRAVAADPRFAAERLTRARLARVAAIAGDAPIVMLVEARPSFYSFLGGRYRWAVPARVTIARRDAPGEAVSSDIDAAAFLDFDHQREAEALAAVADAVAARTGALVDDFLGDFPGARAP